MVFLLTNFYIPMATEYTIISIGAIFQSITLLFMEK